MSEHQSDAQLLREIARHARAALCRRDAGHDALHLERVVLNARGLIDAERAAGRDVDAFVVEAANWLHDLVQFPKGSGPVGESARRSATAARELLATLGIDASTIDAIAHAIETHSFSGGLPPATLEAAIVQDADRLDALGAIGVARLFVTAGELGSRLYHGVDPLGATRELDDRAYALDHIERKLLKLPELMNTAAGRAEAERRAEYLRAFRAMLLRESGKRGSHVTPQPATQRVPGPRGERAGYPLGGGLGGDVTPAPMNSLAAAIASGQLAGELLHPGVPTPTVPAAAVALGVDEAQILKSLLFVAADGAAVLAIVTGVSRVERGKLAAVAGVAQLKMAAPEVVLERTGYPAGGVAPVCHATALEVIVDASVLALTEAYAGGGSVDAMLRIAPTEIVRATGAKVADIVV